MFDRAYAVLHVKDHDGERRVITGVASTPTPDRSGDILDPLGVTFNNPLPLLLHHDKTRPVGTVTLKPPTAAGVEFEASLPFIADEGAVRDRVEEAWTSIKAGLIRGVSVGYRPRGAMKDAVEFLKSGGVRFKRSEFLEISLVTVPANMEATIRTIKSFDAPYLAAPGPNPSGVPDLPIVRAQKGAPTMATTAEQIKTWETTRATKMTRLTALMEEGGTDETTFTEDQQKEYTNLRNEIAAIDKQLDTLREYETMLAKSAKPVAPAGDPARPVVQHTNDGVPMVVVKPNIEKGTAFIRSVMAKVACQGNLMQAIEYAKRWKDSTPETEIILKAAVAAGDTVNPAWAGALVVVNRATNEFLELLRPATIIGKIPGLRQVPFNTSVPVQTSGGTYGWVGQGAPKPVGKLGLTTAVLAFSKAAGIIVITEELARLSTPSAEAVVRGDMIAGMAQFLDQQFIDPAVAVVANVSPASITNGTVAIASGGDIAADLRALIGWFATNNIPLGGLTLIMSEANGFILGQKVNAQGMKVYPNVSVAGGSIDGMTVVTSNTAGTNVIAVQPRYVLFADDGGVTIDVSREASVQMDSAPDNPALATTVLTSLWQNNLVGLRAERFINWLRAKTEAVKYVSGATYPSGLEAPADAPPASGRRSNGPGAAGASA
jgi:HK97 family phage major capsid protein/HK97 family phage prohead protease